MNKLRNWLFVRASLCFLTIVLLVAMSSWLPMPVKTAPAAIETDSLPEGLTSGDWAGMQAAIRQAEYHFTWHEPSMTYKAPNRAHGWGLAFDATGVQVTARQRETWSWGLTLTRYGYQGQLQAITDTPAQTVDANRVEYCHAEGQFLEWYLNDERGLEQGFTFQSPPLPRSAASLHIEMAITGDLIPRMTEDNQAILFADADGQVILRYGELYVTDATGRQLPAHFELPASWEGGGWGLRVVIDDSDAVYPLTVDPLLTSQMAKLTASDGAAHDLFGSSAAISGDTVVVGAHGDDWYEGSAYVFERNWGGTADNWGQVKKLTANDGAREDYFGCSVAISGDIIVVGAYRDDVGNNDEQGSAYVFRRNQGDADNWGQVKKLTANDGAREDYFGGSVAISGDTVVVGAWGDDVGTKSSQGSVYVFERNQGGVADVWGQVKKLTASDGAAGDRFSYSVGISGDTIVVGAYSDDSSKGSAYVFERNQGGADNWGQVKKAIASDGAANDWFGYSVAISGDTFVVGAPADDSHKGSAYIFTRNQGGADQWGLVRKLTASDGTAGDYFGISVAIGGDSVVVGAHIDDSSKGSAYVFVRRGEVWEQEQKRTASDGAASDWFGRSVAVSGDTVVVGAHGDDSFKGSAYVFERNQGGADNWGQVRKLTASDGAAGDNFGISVAISGDTVVVGASHDDSYRGSAYVFERNQGGADNWGQVRKITVGDGAAFDYFGDSVAISGDTVVVGAHLDDDTAANSGSAYVFERNQGGADNWSRVRKLTASDAAADDYFGWSVAISGDTVIVGAPWDNAEATNSGSAYVFERNHGGADRWGQVEELSATDGAANDEFGYSVAISGDTIVVGAPYDDGPLTFLDIGSAYVFERNHGGTADNWGQIRKINPSFALRSASFGNSVSLSVDTAVVGAVGEGSGRGSAYVFERNQGGAADNWGQVRKLTASDGAADDTFGRSVAISGDTVVIGAPGDDIGVNGNQGSTYVFRQAACLDLNGDDVVNIVDIMLVVARWGMTSTDPDWDPLYDLDGDGSIGIADIMLVASHWRQHC